jgi:hypothetical protein
LTFACMDCQVAVIPRGVVVTVEITAGTTVSNDVTAAGRTAELSVVASELVVSACDTSGKVSCM